MLLPLKRAPEYRPSPPAFWKPVTKPVMPALRSGRLEGVLPWAPMEPDMSMTKLKSAASQTSPLRSGLEVPLLMVR